MGQYCEGTPHSKVHGANIGPTWALSAPDGPMLAPGTLLSGTSCTKTTAATLIWATASCAVSLYMASAFRLRIVMARDEPHGWLEYNTWWRYQMETFYRVCERNSPVIGGSPSQKPVARSFDVFFDLRLNKRLSKQSRRLALILTPL